MHKLTKDQSKWLRKIKIAEYQSPKLRFVHVNNFDGQLYAAKTDRYRIHAVPTDAPIGAYELSPDGTLTPVEVDVIGWVSCVPRTFVYEGGVFKKAKKELKTLSPEYGVVISDVPTIHLDWRHLYDALSYAGACIQRYNAKQGTPVRYDYPDGALAMVMPMHSK